MIVGSPEGVRSADCQAGSQAEAYWEKRLQSHFNQQGAGHIGFSNAYNACLYKRKLRCIEALFKGRSLEGKKVLEIGCGTGFFVDWFLGKGAEVYGIDISSLSVQVMANKYPGQFAVRDITSTEFSLPLKFDIVNFWDGAYHFADDVEFKQCMKNAASACNEHGLLLISDKAGAECDLSEGHRVKFRCIETYRRVLTGYGFSLRTILPLYHLLNRRIMPHLDEFLAPLYFLADNHRRKIGKKNLCLCVWQRNTGGGAGEGNEAA